MHASDEQLLLIDGQRRASHDGATFESINPATEVVLGAVPDATHRDVDQAIGAARRAFDETTWATDHELRARCLHQLHQALLDNLEALRELTVAEVGVPVLMTPGPALEFAVELVGYYAELCERYERHQDLGTIAARGGFHHRWVEREAVGVVTAISAYNYPNQLNLAKLAPALAAGCTVVLKGSPETSLITLALGQLIAEHTDIPAGVVNVIAASSPAVGVQLTSDPRVDLVSFTGSTAVGRSIMAQASATVKRCFLELGGKSAYLVLDEESVGAAAMYCAFAAASHAGQGCAITSRLVVPRAQLDAAAAVVADTFNGLSIGDPTDPSTFLGPLISQRQRERVQGFVDRAERAGARIVTGGGPPDHLDKGFFFSPTLVVGAAEDSEIAQEEVFGPVLTLLGHDGDDDAVRIANSTIYGLSGSVQATDRDRAVAVARRVRSGTLSVNGGFYLAPDVPFGGYKQSGFGREWGEAGLEEFLNIKTFAEAVPEEA